MFQLKNAQPLRLVRIAAVAAIYVVLTVFLPLSYESVQFRVAEMLMLLCFYNKDYCVSLTLGCAIANLFSPFMLLDVPIGTAATLIAAVLMWKCPSIYAASLFPVISNALMVGAELTYIDNTPFLLNAGFVALGEFVVVCVLGVAVFRAVLQRNKGFMRLIGNEKVAGV